MGRKLLIINYDNDIVITKSTGKNVTIGERRMQLLVAAQAPERLEIPRGHLFPPGVKCLSVFSV